MALYAKRKSAAEYVNELSGDYMYKISNDGLEEWKTSFNKEKRKSEMVATRKQVKFSWCNINVFAPAPPVSKPKTKEILPMTEKNIEQTQKHILKDVSGIAHPGELLLIMGSSGAGKTTLLNCMTFRNLKGLTVSGLVCINDVAVSQTELAARSAYIQQEDMFIKYLTVKEHLIFQAQVRMDSHYTYEEKMERIEQVMRELSLKKCENCLIGLPGVIKGISGGERKRLAFASELLTKPSLLFCDEPTTGLDSFMSLNVAQMLKDISRSGRTVIATLHQPSSDLFHMFDKLCLMAEGRTAFLGSLEEAEPFFTKLHFPCPQSFNPADHYIQVLAIVPGKEMECRKIVDKICDSFAVKTELGLKIKEATAKTVKSAKTSENKWTHKKGAISPYRVGWWGQIKAVFWRSWLSIIKNPKMTTIRFYLAIIEAIFIIAIYYGQVMNQLGIKNIEGVFFFLLTTSSFQNFFTVLDAFCEELPLFMKEHKDGMYRTDVYYLSKIICDIPISIFLQCFKTALFYYLVGLNPDPIKFCNVLFISALFSQAARGGGLIISTIAPNMHFASVSTSFFVTPLLILGGFYMNNSSVPVYLQWLANLSWFKFAYEAFMINQWDDINYIQCPLNSTDTVCISNGMQVLESAALNPGGFWMAITALFLLAVAFRIIAFLVLLYKASCKV